MRSHVRGKRGIVAQHRHTLHHPTPSHTHGGAPPHLSPVRGSSSGPMNTIPSEPWGIPIQKRVDLSARTATSTSYATPPHTQSCMPAPMPPLAVPSYQTPTPPSQTLSVDNVDALWACSTAHTHSYTYASALPNTSHTHSQSCMPPPMPPSTLRLS